MLVRVAAVYTAAALSIAEWAAALAAGLIEQASLALAETVGPAAAEHTWAAMAELAIAAQVLELFEEQDTAAFAGLFAAVDSQAVDCTAELAAVVAATERQVDLVCSQQDTAAFVEVAFAFGHP